MLVLKLFFKYRIPVCHTVLFMALLALPIVNVEARDLDAQDRGKLKKFLVDVCHHDKKGGFKIISVSEAAAKKHYSKHSADVAPTNDLCISPGNITCPISKKLQKIGWNHEPDGLDDEGRCMADVYNPSSSGKAKFQQSLEILLLSEGQAEVIHSANNDDSSTTSMLISVAQAAACARMVKCKNFLPASN